MSYTAGYQCRASLRCPHDFCAGSAYCNLLYFLIAPSLISILSIRQALFSGSNAGKGSRNKVHMFFMYIMTKISLCYHAMAQALWFSILWQIDNFLSRTCLSIAQRTIGIGLRFYILVWSVSIAVLFFVQFYKFPIFVQFLISRWKLCLFVCLFVCCCFFFSSSD